MSLAREALDVKESGDYGRSLMQVAHNVSEYISQTRVVEFVNLADQLNIPQRPVQVHGKIFTGSRKIPNGRKWNGRSKGDVQPTYNHFFVNKGYGWELRAPLNNSRVQLPGIAITNQREVLVYSRTIDSLRLAIRKDSYVPPLPQPDSLVIEKDSLVPLVGETMFAKEEFDAHGIPGYELNGFALMKAFIARHITRADIEVLGL